MTKLSVNINKFATLRNARGGNNPDVQAVALACERFGAQGITVHPRPDERHIRYQDVRDLAPRLNTEFNIEGFPCRDFCDLVCEVVPRQVTLVPDSPEQLTSNHGWDVARHKEELQDLVAQFHSKGIRTSIFIDADLKAVEAAAATGTDRVELYTEPFASQYPCDREKAVAAFVEAGKLCREIGLGLNAGHDLSLQNLAYLHSNIPWIDEVSIGHALICDALFYGLESTIQKYLDCLK